jgi:hypothetical protein
MFPNWLPVVEVLGVAGVQALAAGADADLVDA